MNRIPVNECACVTHTVPHWLYADAAERHSNIEAFENALRGSLGGGAFAPATPRDRVQLAVFALATRERERFARLRADLVASGIGTIPKALRLRAEIEAASAHVTHARAATDRALTELASVEVTLDALARERDVGGTSVERMNALHARASSLRATIVAAPKIDAEWQAELSAGETVRARAYRAAGRGFILEVNPDKAYALIHEPALAEVATP